jgi:hypothetical protein
MKEKLQNILNKYLNQHMNRENLNSLYLQLKEFFKSQDLEELQFKIIPNVNVIQIIGIRQIDIYALIGILK